MNAIWRPAAAIASAVGMLVLGLSASAPTANAQPPSSSTITGTIKTPTGVCANGEVAVYLWYVDPSTDAGGYWGYYDDFSTAVDGTYSHALDSGDIGKSALVRGTCNGGDYASVYYGGSFALPSSATATNSKQLVAGTISFGVITVGLSVALDGTIHQVDDSTLPYWDRTGTLLPADSSIRNERARYGIDAWAEFFMPGADITKDNYVVRCGASSVGAFSCKAPVGTYDLRIFAMGWDDRAVPTFNYPQTISLMTNFQVTAASASSLLSLKTAAGPAAVLTTAPKIAGTAKVGNVLTAVPGVWNNLGFSATDPVFSYQWLRGGVVVGTAETYPLTAADANQSIALRVTVSRALFTAASADAAPVLVAVADDTRLVSSASAKFGKLKKGKKGAVTVVVRAAGMGALGKVSVAEGAKTFVSKSLVAKNNGKVVLKFKAPKKGVHTFTITYFGNAQVKGVAITKTVKVK